MSLDELVTGSYVWNSEWRERTWQLIAGPWDIVVVGGGITGVGVLREATRLGLHVLLVEQRDFAWGSSSRSSKLVHGGFRYIKEGKLRLTRNLVHEREILLHEGPGLIDPLGFLLTIHKGDFPGRWTYEMGLSLYDLLALRWDHDYYSPQNFQLLAPHIIQDNLQGGFRFVDAQTDDARLTLRVLREAAVEGGTAINFVKAEGLIIEGEDVRGVQLVDQLTGRKADARAQVVVNATGAWAEGLIRSNDSSPAIRPLRGSHLIFPSWRLPVAQAFGFLHPLDHRPVFIFPWEGITLLGTTDVDHDGELDLEPKIGPEEVSYLMAAVEYQFPSLGIGLEDVISTYAGVRAVIGSGKENPSQESRDHIIWEDKGLVTVTGGKLTTFRLIALDVLRAIRHRLHDMPEPNSDMPVLNTIDIDLPGCEKFSDTCRRRLLGRFGADAIRIVECAEPGEMETIGGTNYRWAELRWSARSEAVCHLDDLLLRRTRLGLILPRGAESILSGVKQICMEELGWSEARWQQEQRDYLKLWWKVYSLPARENIPDWKAPVGEALQRQRIRLQMRNMKQMRRSGLMLASLMLVAGFIAIVWSRTRRTT